MQLNKILEWSPFLYKFVSYDNKPHAITFTCPKCGGHNCEKIDTIESDNFWSGYYRCTDCGNKRDNDGNQICYYSSCFNNTDLTMNMQWRPADDSEVADLCLHCVHRPKIYMLLSMPFCNKSSNTCAKRHHKTKCTDYERKQPIQLSLF